MIPLDECPVPMWQNPTEFGHFFRFLEMRSISRVLEIGSFYGGTLWAWTWLPWVGRIVSVDLPVAQGNEHWEGVWAARTQWADWMRPKGIDFHDLIGPSNDWFIADAAEKQGPYEFIFIDGDHSYEGVKHDFVRYRPMLAPGGCVAFHDTKRHEPGVIQFAAELKELHPTIEFFSPDWGAGILLVFP